MTRIIGDDSPLAKLPANLNHLQRGWTEGLRYSIEICDLAYRRLCYCLLEIANNSATENAGSIPPELRIAAFADAWTLVDGAWRLKRLLADRPFPIPVGTVPPPEAGRMTVDIKPFRAAVAPVKRLRNAFQHLDDLIARNDVKDKLLWGHLTWYIARPELKGVDICTLVDGTMPRGSIAFDVIDTRGGSFRIPIDRVSLSAYDAHVDLTALHDSIVGVVRGFEALLGPQFEGSARESGGMLMKACLRFKEAGVNSDEKETA